MLRGVPWPLPCSSKYMASGRRTVTVRENRSTRPSGFEPIGSRLSFVENLNALAPASASLICRMMRSPSVAAAAVPGSGSREHAGAARVRRAPITSSGRKDLDIVCLGSRWSWAIGEDPGYIRVSRRNWYPTLRVRKSVPVRAARPEL